MRRRRTRAARRKVGGDQLALFQEKAAPRTPDGDASAGGSGKRPRTLERGWHVSGVGYSGQTGWQITLRTAGGREVSVTKDDPSSAVVSAAAQLEVLETISAQAALAAVRTFLEAQTAATIAMEDSLTRKRSLRHLLAPR